MARGRAGSLKVGFTAASAYSYLPSLVAACRNELPDVALSLKEMVSGDQLKRLLSGEIDIGLMRPPMPPVGLCSFRVMAEPMLVALPRNHPRARQTSVKLEHQLAAGVEDPVLADTWMGFSELPHGTLGRAVWDMYRTRGFGLPGSVGGASAYLAQHDFVHVIADYGTNLDGELEVTTYGKPAHGP